MSFLVENPDYYHILGRIFIAQYKYKQAKDYLSKALKLHNQAQDLVGMWDDMMSTTFALWSTTLAQIFASLGS